VTYFLLAVVMFLLGKFGIATLGLTALLGLANCQEAH
jgi:hypothetical protein